MAQFPKWLKDFQDAGRKSLEAFKPDLSLPTFPSKESWDKVGKIIDEADAQIAKNKARAHQLLAASGRLPSGGDVPYDVAHRLIVAALTLKD
jgi:hypothetical protein